MDDVDAVQAQISRNMLQSGDWVTARLDGIKYLEKSPLKYWMIAVCFKLFGVHDWAARIPVALSAVLLCWLVARMGRWAFSPGAGLYAGLSLATSVGLFLFTRILIPDVVLTLTIALSLWAFLRALDEQETRPGLWSLIFAASVGAGLLLKGLIAALFPLAAVGLYLAFTKQLTDRRVWQRLHPFRGAGIALAIAAPWHILATLRNPPYFYWSMQSGPGHYHGFFWFYFINEHLLRFLNLRYPRDYNTVPRLYFWLFHLLWLFPWSVFFPAAFRSLRRLSTTDRAGRMRLMALCWAGFILVFFTFSSTQEYYSMPAYPALALLLGAALDSEDRWIGYGRRVLAVLAGAAAMVIAGILVAVHGLPAPGDISNALTQNPDLYTLSLGHMGDLTLRSFAYLRLPLALAGVAFLIGAVTSWRWSGLRAALGIATMMVLFIHAARLAMVVFDPYLGSRQLANALMAAPPGKLILDDQYYTWSSVIFYTNRNALLLNGRVNNLEYGSNDPEAPDGVFLNDKDFKRLWATPARYYILVEKPSVPRIAGLTAGAALRQVAESGGKYLFVNH
ncbi:MAG TPA: glycosyltransferase family 39 protein [Bryobacteraceae bacterium]|jgi:4-amino-4-deoxy-L-arabinose transferase-like glycosyltransferase